MSKVYTGYCGTSEIEHGLCACTVDNPLAKARGLSLRTGAQTMLYLPLVTKGHNSIKKQSWCCSLIICILPDDAVYLNYLSQSDIFSRSNIMERIRFGQIAEQTDK